MLKKMIIAGLATIVIGATGVGAYDAWQSGRVVSHTPSVEAASEGNGNQGNYNDSVAQAQGNGQDRQGSQGEAASQGGAQGYQGGQGQADTLAQGGSQGYRGGRGGADRGNAAVQGKGNGGTESHGSGDGSSVPQAQVQEWLTLTGAITGIDQTGLTLSTDDGQTLTLELGQPRFWTSQGVELQSGDIVEVLGFRTDEGYGLVFQTATITRLSDGATIQLRDADGRPLWAGRGRG